MGRRLYWALTGISALVLAASFRVSSQAGQSGAAGVGSLPAQASTPSPTASAGSGEPGASVSPSARASAGTGDSAGASSSLKDGTYAGAASQTPFGDVQVQITVSGGKVTDAQATSYPSADQHSQQLSGYAVPVLNQEAVQAGSAQIDMVSGATYTSQAYAQSLQAALDQAHQ